MNSIFGPEGQPPKPSIFSKAPSAAAPAVPSSQPVAEESSKPMAWQPFTFGGVAAFCTAALSRVLLVQLMVGLLVGAGVVRFVNTNYSPVLVRAIHQLPEDTILKYGALSGSESGLLAEGKFLSLAIDLEGESDFGQSSDLQVELHRSNFQVSSMLRSVAGVWKIDYPVDTYLPLNPSLLEPWWGAWHPIIYVAILVLVAGLLMITWALLAMLYMAPVRLIAYYADRQLTMSGAWKLASAGLMPGAITMIGGIFLYGWQVLDLIGLGAFVLLHLLVGWVYVFVSPCRIKQTISDASKNNPFVGSDANHKGTETQSGE